MATTSQGDALKSLDVCHYLAFKEEKKYSVYVDL